MKTNFDDLWGIHEEPRLPIKAIGWTVAPPEMELRRPTRRDTTPSFVHGVFSGNEDRLFKDMGTLLETHAADFAIAAQAIKPEAWRLLHYRGVFVPEALLVFRFHPEQALRDLCSRNDALNDPPQSWLGTDRSTADIADELEFTLREIGSGPSSAAWLVLALAQKVALTKAECLLCAFWDPTWLRQFVDRVRLID